MELERAVAQVVDQALLGVGRFRWGKVSRVVSTSGQPVEVTVGDGSDARVMRAAKQAVPLTVGAWVIWWDEAGNSFVLGRLEIGA